LCNSVKPGEQVQAVGIYLLLPTARTKLQFTFDRYFVVLSIKTLEKQVELRKSSRMNFPKAEDRYKICSMSIAPSLSGH